MKELVTAGVQAFLQRIETLDEVLHDVLNDDVFIIDGSGVVTATVRTEGSIRLPDGHLLTAGLVGDNYLGTCRDLAGDGNSLARQALDGIAGVLSHEHPDFVMTYESRDAGSRRTFALTASPLVSGVEGAIISNREILVSPQQRSLLPGDPTLLSFGSVGVSIMPAMARSLVEALGVGHAVICEQLASAPHQLRVVAHWAGQELSADPAFLPGVLRFEELNDGYYWYVPAHLQDLFPGDVWLKTIGAESAFGVPIYGSAQDVIGYVAVLDTQPIGVDTGSELLLRLAAVRLAPELERRRALWSAALEARLVASAPDAIIATDADYSITSWNPAATTIYGWQPEEAIGRSSTELLHTEYRIGGREDLLERLHRGEEFRGEYLQRHKDGRIMEIEATTMAFHDADGSISGYMSVNRDVTERKLAEQKLQEALTAKDQFLSLVSHELRTPLTMIMGNAWSMAHRSESMIREQLVESADAIYEQSVKLTAIIENLLSLARAERGERIVLEPVDLSRLLRQVLIHPEVAGQHNVELDVADGDVLVLANSMSVEQVVLNLLTNAAKYGPRDSTIFIKLAVDEPRAVVSVRDQGKGIPEGQLQQIFQPYFRAEDVTDIPGMGIGLTVCRRLVAAMNGEIWASNHVAGGAVFSFTLPLIEALQDEQPRRLDLVSRSVEEDDSPEEQEVAS